MPVQWRLRRNCALDPRRTMLGFFALIAFNSLLGAAFSWLGYAVIMLFVVLVHAGFAIALCAYARHATDCETLTLHDGRLSVEQRCGASLTRTDLQAVWVRVIVPHQAGDLVALCDSRRSVQVGRHVPPHMRSQLAQDIRRALVEAGRRKARFAAGGVER